MERITERKLKDKRFRANEEAILVALISAKERLSPIRLARHAGISRATFYRHHKNVHEIVDDYERYILRKCKNTVMRLIKKNAHVKTVFQRILIFLSANKMIVKFLLENGCPGLIEKIVLALKPKIIATGKVADGEMYNLYAKEVSGLIETWCRDGFNVDEISVTANKIMYLTKTAYMRLSPLKAFDV